MTTPSAPLVVKKSQQGENATEWEGPSWPYSVYKMWPYLKSQILRVESLLQDKRYLPFGWKSISLASLLCASYV